MTKNLPVIVLKGIFLLPHNEIKLDFENEIGNKLIDINNSPIIIINDINEKNSDISNLPKYGVITNVSKIIELPNSKVRVVLTGIKRANILKYIETKNKLNLEAEVTEIDEYFIDDEEFLLKKLYKEVLNYTNNVSYVSNSIIDTLKNQESLDSATDIVVNYLDLEPERIIKYLIENNPVKRFEMLIEDIEIEKKYYEIEKNIDLKVKRNIDSEQKQYFLRQKLNIIKDELGQSDTKNVNDLKEKLNNIDLNDDIKMKVLSEIDRYDSLPINSPELALSKDYIDWILSLPWNKYTLDNDDLIDVRNKLDETHSGLEEVKDRIIEYLAVKQFMGNLKSPIICLVGPPGVGKTSLAYSIANAMKRKFVKISVGGINDEAEIIGHRRTYIGALPGRIISSLKKANSSNPVFLIDEIDKMTKSIKGDPYNALISVLDSDQNNHFVDNYIEEEFDLSKVLFILTANQIDDLPEALKDRLEIINLSGYTEYEKLFIVRDYLIPKICKEYGLNKSSIKIKDEQLLFIIKNYTRELGVRELERVISKIIRKYICTIVGKPIKSNYIKLDSKKIKEYLGDPKFDYNKKRNNNIGEVNIMGYTPYGGDILKIEVNCFEGTGKINITGLIGDVMKESVQVALSYVKSNYKKFNIDYEKITKNDIHIHIPEGAIKKDGPSAGIAIVTSLISYFSNRKVSNNIAFTGEITLNGTILKIGGLKEKIIGAYQYGIKKIIIPFENKNDIEKLPEELKNNIEFIYANNYLEVYKEVFK